MYLTIKFTLKTISVSLFIFPFFIFSQVENPEFTIENQIYVSTAVQNPSIIKNQIIDYPDVEAQFHGGSSEMMKYLIENFHYSETYINEDPYGRIYIEFVVNIDGSIEDMKILKGISKELDEELIRVVKNMPKWIPAVANGENVRSKKRLAFTIHP